MAVFWLSPLYGQQHSTWHHYFGLVIVSGSSILGVVGLVFGPTTPSVEPRSGHGKCFWGWMSALKIST